MYEPLVMTRLIATEDDSGWMLLLTNEGSAGTGAPGGMTTEGATDANEVDGAPAGQQRAHTFNVISRGAHPLTSSGALSQGKKRSEVSTPMPGGRQCELPPTG